MSEQEFEASKIFDTQYIEIDFDSFGEFEASYGIVSGSRGQLMYCVEDKTWYGYDGAQWHALDFQDLMESARFALVNTTEYVRSDSKRAIEDYKRRFGDAAKDKLDYDQNLIRQCNDALKKLGNLAFMQRVMKYTQEDKWRHISLEDVHSGKPTNIYEEYRQSQLEKAQ